MLGWPLLTGLHPQPGILYFETGPHYVVLAGLELPMWPKQFLNFALPLEYTDYRYYQIGLVEAAFYFILFYCYFSLYQFYRFSAFIFFLCFIDSLWISYNLPQSYSSPCPSGSALATSPQK